MEGELTPTHRKVGHLAAELAVLDRGRLAFDLGGLMPVELDPLHQPPMRPPGARGPLFRPGHEQSGHLVPERNAVGIARLAGLFDAQRSHGDGVLAELLSEAPYNFGAGSAQLRPFLLTAYLFLHHRQDHRTPSGLPSTPRTSGNVTTTRQRG